jgi:hypothetical protein
MLKKRGEKWGMSARKAIVIGMASVAFYLIMLGGICEAVETKQEGGASTKMGKETNVIDGVARLQWGKGMENTYMGALTVAMNAIGEDVTYDYLMGISGAAFRLHIYHPGWCPSAPDATCGFNHSKPAMKAMGYKMTGIHSDMSKPEDVEKVRNAVVKSIDKGYPVLAIDLKEVPDWGVIVGYDDGGKEFLCRTYYDKTDEYTKAEKWPWVVDIIKEKTDKPSQKKSVLESLRIAVEIANTEKYGDYASGFNAYEAWIADLLADENFEDEEKVKSYSTHANAWSYSSLGDARAAAIKYLRSISSLFGEESTPHLEKATEIYEEILSKLKDGFEYAPYPWQLKDGKQWTAEMRHAEADVLKEVLALEREAVRELETALTLEEKEIYPEVLLKKDVDEFHDLIGRFGHGVVGSSEVYCQPCAYLSLHLLQMRAVGWEDMDFDQLAAVSGASALFAYQEDDFMPKYANLHIGMDDRIAEAIGFGYEWIDFKGIDEAWELIRESVDSGKSVKGWDWENILFAGYQDATNPDDRKVFAMADGPDTYAKWWTWKEFGEYIERMQNWKSTRFGRHTERVPTKPKNEVALKVIKDLVEWSTNPPEHLLKKYPKATFGLDGIELYAKNCADMEKFQDFGACHGMNPQWHIRNSSSVYLKQVAEANIFPEKLDAHLLKAADEYKAAYVYWKQFFNHLSYGGGEGWGKVEEHRMAGAEGIRKALEHEKLAIAELKAMLEKHEKGDLFSYGFRYDPMKFVEESDSLQAVLVRRHVFHNPKPGDDEIIQKRIEEILAGQREDGTLGEPGHERAELLMELADLGADPNRPEIKKAIEASLQNNDSKPGPWIRDIRALCMFGVTEPPQIKAALEAIMEREEEWNGPYKICPWGQAFYIRALWEARDVVDTKPLIARTLTWMSNGLNDAGCITYKDPWGLIWAAGIIDMPEAKHLVELEIPTILRGQQPDGGWGTGPYGSWSRESLKVYQALVNHGYFDMLRELPPLPEDWKIIREIPAPDGDLFTMTYDGERLWVLDREKHEAIAVSSDDGSIQKRLSIPFEKVGGIGWWDDGLGVTQKDEKRLIKLNPESGQIVQELQLKGPDWVQVFDFARVNGELWISDGFNGMVVRRKADNPEKTDFLTLGGPQPISISADSNGVWHIDAFAPIIAKTSFEGKLLEWGEKPFNGRCDGLAWDGKQLWALDTEGKRICVIEKNAHTE